MYHFVVPVCILNPLTQNVLNVQLFPFIAILASRFLAINALLVYLYFSSYQKLDEEEYGGLGEILKEGLMTSFATFLVRFLSHIV